MRPKPRMPSVFSDSSVPENFDRSHLPLVSEACACGMLRASASSSAIVCSAAVITLDSGALATTMPRLVAATTSTLSTPTPARPTAFSDVARAISSASSLVAERISSPRSRRSARQLVTIPVGAQIDVEVLAEQRDAGAADVLGHQIRGS